jgi:hypothetical protein
MTMQEPHVDHVIARRHRGRTEAGNLALSCVACNLSKGADLAGIDPESGELAPLFNPRSHVWEEHFQFAGVRIQPLTAIGRTTARLLQLNNSERLAERRLLATYGSLGVDEPPGL